MSEGYSKNLYGLLRKYLKLPRPTEIWGEKVGNKWSPRLVYFYGRLAFGAAMGHLSMPKALLDTAIMFLVLFEVKEIATTWLLVLIGTSIIFAILSVGHILTVNDFIKQENQLAISQSPDMIEIRDNVREIMKHYGKT